MVYECHRVLKSNKLQHSYPAAKSSSDRHCELNFNSEHVQIGARSCRIQIVRFNHRIVCVAGTYVPLFHVWTFIARFRHNWFSNYFALILAYLFCKNLHRSIVILWANNGVFVWKIVLWYLHEWSLVYLRTMKCKEHFQ